MGPSLPAVPQLRTAPISCLDAARLRACAPWRRHAGKGAGRPTAREPVSGRLLVGRGGGRLAVVAGAAAEGDSRTGVPLQALSLHAQDAAGRVLPGAAGSGRRHGRGRREDGECGRYLPGHRTGRGGPTGAAGRPGAVARFSVWCERDARGGGRYRLSRWHVARRHSPGTWAAAGPARSRRVRALGGRARAGGERPRWAPPAGTARLLRWGRGFVLWKERWREGWQHGGNRSQTGYLVPAAK